MTFACDVDFNHGQGTARNVWASSGRMSARTRGEVIAVMICCKPGVRDAGPDIAFRRTVCIADRAGDLFETVVEAKCAATFDVRGRSNQQHAE